MAKRWILLTVLFLFPFHVYAQDDTRAPYTTADGLLTVQYPSAWIIDEADGIILLSNQESAMMKNARQLVNDEILISFTLFPTADVSQELNATTPMDGMNALMSVFTESDFESSFGPPKATLISGNEAALVKGIVEGENGVTINVMMIVADLEGENYLFIVGASAAPRSLMDTTTYALVKTLEYGD